MVFQDYLLFPHLTVLDNVAFGPQARGVRRPDARRHAADWLGRIGIVDLAASRPRSISGGQAQRVALARALATEPKLLLLDEPLAALDARTRMQVRGELRRHLAGFGGATVVVTHDPVDAAVLGDRLVVIEDGRVVQSGRPAEVARQPRTDYVARLVGLNLLAGRAVGRRVLLPGGGAVTPVASAGAMCTPRSGRCPWRCSWPGRRAPRATSGRVGSSVWNRTVTAYAWRSPGRPTRRAPSWPR